MKEKATLVIVAIAMSWALIEFTPGRVIENVLFDTAYVYAQCDDDEKDKEVNCYEGSRYVGTEIICVVGNCDCTPDDCPVAQQ